MRLEIGSKVSVIDEALTGIVKQINGEKVTVNFVDFELDFNKKDLVVLGEEQKQLSKYLDINNSLLLEKQQQQKPKKQLFKKQKDGVVMEVDLHIHKLTKSTRGMDNFDMLTLQLDTAKHKVEYCIQKKISKIVFIHGVGEGVLKSELHYLLNKYPVKYYDASYQKYGLGATEVYIYQNPK